eukprot:6800983-Ditylum_brightwellii.AAC.1
MQQKDQALAGIHDIYGCDNIGKTAMAKDVGPFWTIAEFRVVMRDTNAEMILSRKANEFVPLHCCKLMAATFIVDRKRLLM